MAILVDLDQNAATGCTVITVDGPFDGVERILVTSVETTSPPPAGLVTDVAFRVCTDPLSDTFSAPVSFDSGDWPIGIDNGVGGLDVVETYFERAALILPPGVTVVRAGVVVTDELGNEEALLTVDDTPTGAPFVINIDAITEIPTLGTVALLALCLLVSATAVTLLGRRGAVVLLLVVLAAWSGIAWAAGSLDGLIDDWAGDEPIASGGMVLFAKRIGSRVCLRVDVELNFNTSPTADPQTLSTPEETPLAITLTGTDPEGDPLDFTIVPASGPANGLLTGTPPNVTYSPNLDFVGTDSFDFQVEDPSGSDDTATVSITVTQVNDPPVAQDDAYSTPEDTQLVAGSVLANNGSGPDTDVDGDTLTVNTTPVTGPSNGTLALAANGTFTYDPNGDFVGTDTFEYQVSDGNGGTDVGLVTITVTTENDPPVAQDDAYTTAEDTQLLAGSVLLNNGSGPDTDADGDTLTVNTTPVSGPSSGSLTLNADGTFTYDPASNFNGSATFEYQVSDGNGGTDVGLVTITVTAANDDPTANDDGFIVGEDSINNPLAVLANDDDAPDTGETLTVTGVSTPNQGGSASVNGTNDGLIYSPASNFFGDETFTYDISDGNGGTDTATVTVTVSPLNDAPVVDLDANDSNTAGTGFAVAYTESDGAVAAVDTDATITDLDNASLDSVTVTLQNLLDAGQEVLAATSGDPDITVEAYDTTTVPGQGILQLTTTSPQPIADFVAVLLTVSYEHTGDAPDTSAARTIAFVADDGVDVGPAAISTVTISAENDAPVAQDDAYTTAEDTQLVAGSVLLDNGSGPDTDPDGDTLTVNTTPVSGPSSGSLTLNADGTFTYDPALDFNGAATFEYELLDGNGGSDVGLVTITVTAANDNPTANDDGFIIVEDSFNAALAVLANDDDAPDTGETLTVTGVSTPNQGGSAIVSGTNDFVSYTPARNFFGDETFTYDISDGNGGTDTATVTVTVTPLNDAPVVDLDANDSNTVGTGYAFAYTENDGAVAAVDTDATITDLDNASLESVTVTLQNLLDAGLELLAATSGDPDITVEAYDTTTVPGQGILRFTTTSPQPIADFVTVLLTVTYEHTGDDPDTSAARAIAFVADDGADVGPAAISTVTITAENDPPVAQDDAYTTAEDTQLVAGSVLLDNGSGPDTDAEGDTLTVNTTPVSGPTSGSLTLNPDGSFVYDPALDFNGAATFEYEVSDGNGGLDVGLVTITVTAVNDPPDAIDDAASITEEAPNVAAANTTSGNVLSNDTDVDSSLTVTAVNGSGPAVGTTVAGSFGSVTIGSNGAFTYTLDDTNATVNALAPGGMLTDAFSYTASDGEFSDTANLTVTIHGADDPATPDNDAFDFIGNTLLEVDCAAGTCPEATTPKVTATTPAIPALHGVLDGDVDPDGGGGVTLASVVGCGDVSPPYVCDLAGQGDLSLEADGSFSFVPEPGDPDATATFQYTLVGNPLVPGTVTLTRFQRVWYVDPNAGAGNGTSPLPLNTLDSLDGVGGAGDSDVAGDYIFVYEGTLALSGPMELEANQHLIGEGNVEVTSPSNFALSIPVALNGNPSPVNLVATGTRPQLTNAAGNTVTATAAIPIEIVGLSLAGGTTAGGGACGSPSFACNAIDVTTAAALTGSGTLEIANNVFRGAGSEGLDVTLATGTTGTLALVVTTNSWSAAGTHTGNAVDVGRVAGTLHLNFSANTGILSAANAVNVTGGTAASTFITGFANNSVHSATGGSGILIDNATFDATPGAPFNQVTGANTVVGASGDGVGASGVLLTNVLGDLAFTDLDVFADNTAGGAALMVTSTGAVNVAAGTGARVTVGAGVAIIDAAGGPAVSVNNASVNLPLGTLESTNSTSTGVSLVNAFGGGGTTLSAGAGSISDPTSPTVSGTAVNISGGEGNITIGIPVTNNSGNSVVVASHTSGTVSFTAAVIDTGSGISLTGNTGSTISFRGSLSASTGASGAFNATGGGTVEICDENPCSASAGALVNTLATTSGIALNVENTTISSNGIVLRSVSANGASHGIRVSNAGTGPIAITGTGTDDDSGGTIQNITNRGAGFTTTGSVSLANMQFTNAATTNGADPTVASSTCGDVKTDTGGSNTGCNAPVHLQSLTGATLSNLDVAGSAQVGINLNNVTNFSLSDSLIQNVGNQVREYGIKGQNVVGTVQITSTTIDNSFEDNVRAHSNSATAANWTVSNSTFSDSGLVGFQVISDSGADTVLTVTNCNFTSNFSAGMFVGTVVATAADGTTFDLTVNGGTFNANNDAMRIVGTGSADVTFDVINIGTMTNNPAGGVTVVLQNTSLAAASMSGTITGNTIVMPASGAGDAIQVDSSGAGTTTVLISGNTITNRTQRGVFGQRGDGVGGTLNITVQNNTVTTSDTNGDLLFPADGIHIAGGTTSADTGVLCAHVTGNAATGAGDVADNSGEDDIFLRHRFGIQFRVPGIAAPFGAAQAIAVLTANNPASDKENATTTSAFTSAASCPVP